jgi:hypothetical protein
MALAAVLYLPSLFWSLGLDQNIFAEIGWLLLHGKKLYVDAWDVKPPNIFYVYALFEWLFGANGFAVRLSDYVFALIAFSAIFIAIRRQTAGLANGLMQTWAAPLSAIFLALTLLSLGLADTAQTESYSLACIIGAVALICGEPTPTPSLKRRGDLNKQRLFFAGVLIAIATFFKTTNAVFLLPISIEIFFRDRKSCVRSILFLIAGVLLWCGVQIGVLAIEGSLGEYLRITMSVLAHHTNEASDLSRWSLFRAIWTYVDIWGILSVIAILTAVFRRDGAFLRSVRMALFLLIAGMAAVLIQNKGWGYQYVVLLPGLVSLCAISGIYLYERIRAKSRWIAAVFAIFLLLHTLLMAPSAHRRVHYCSDALLSVRDHSDYVATLGSRKSLYYPAGTDALATYLSKHATPKDEIFIFGEEPGAYWQADRMPATRFVYSLLFTSGVIPDSDLLAINDTLVRREPAIIAIERFDTTVFRGRPETSESLFANDTSFSNLRELLAKHYQTCDTVCDKFIVYRKSN